MVTKYQKYNMRPEFFFRSMNISITNRCNRNCKFCCGVKKKEAVDMDFDKLKELLKACLLDGNIKIFYPACTSEATLYPHIVDMVKYIDTFGKKDIIVLNDTNGGFIPNGFIDAINNACYTYNLSFSFWGYDKKSYFEYQGGDFDETVENVTTYINELKKPFSFSVCQISKEQCNKTVEFLQNLLENNGKKSVITTDPTEELVREIHNNGYYTIYLRPYIMDDHVVDNNNTVRNYIKFNNCINLYKQIIVQTDGDIAPCMRFASAKTPFSIGNINDYAPITWKDIVDIYNGDKAKGFWHKNYTPKDFAFDDCSTCISRICL